MYFDPGTGSMIVQIVIAAVAGVGAFFVTFNNNIKGIFKKNVKKSK